MIRYAAIGLWLMFLTACGEGYRIEPARLDLIDATAEDHRELSSTLSGLLAREGFEDLGRDDTMIYLLKQSDDPDEDLIDRYERQHFYLNRSRNLSVDMLDYSDGRAPHLITDDPRRTSNFVEISISESRPGGMSPEAKQFYSHLLRTLKARFGDKIVVINGPPPNDEDEYQRITWNNRISATIAWCVAFFLSSLLVGSITLFALKRAKLGPWPRRLIFTGVNTWLSSPVLMQAATIFVIPAPNLVAAPWTDPELYTRGAPFHQISFACAFILSAALSLTVIKDRRATRTPGDQQTSDAT